MKKKISIVVFVLAVMSAGIGIKSSVKSTNFSSLSIKNIEAISSCEIVNSKGVTVFKCEGEKETCSGQALGKTLTCSGKSVAL